MDNQKRIMKENTLKFEYTSIFRVNIHARDTIFGPYFGTNNETSNSTHVETVLILTSMKRTKTPKYVIQDFADLNTSVRDMEWKNGKN